jgi:predicted phosphodiesterase
LLCRCDEYATWSKQDVHRNAYTVLMGDRTKQMGEWMRKGDHFEQRKECLSCHGVFDNETKQQPETFEKEGVTCVVCHGAIQGLG